MDSFHRTASSVMALTLCVAVLLLGATGCSTPTSAKDIADNGGIDGEKFAPAEKTTVVGSMGWVSYIDSTGTVALNRDAFPPGVILVTRNTNLQTTGILETTPTNYGKHQGVLIVNGEPKQGDEVVEPGPELAPLVQFNLGRNRERQAEAVMEAAGSAAPEVVPGQ